MSENLSSDFRAYLRPHSKLYSEDQFCGVGGPFGCGSVLMDGGPESLLTSGIEDSDLRYVNRICCLTITSIALK